MEDNRIIELFFSRSEQAITELANKYGGAARKVALNILDNSQDAEECVNDAYLGAWNSIPSGTEKSRLSTEDNLTEIIENFLDTLDKKSRVMFVKRYWYAESLKVIAADFGVTENHISVKLLRIRKKMKAYLEKEGVVL